ncbi:MAG TPA: redoxin family protein [Opitutaceae bacterium]
MSRPTRILSISLLVFAALAARADDPKPIAIGTPMPHFDLPGVDGKTYTPASFADAKILCLIFTCNHCPTAQRYEKRLKQLTADYAPKGVAVVAINPNNATAVRLDEMAYTDLGDSFEEMKVRAEHKGFNFPYLDDGPTQAVSRAFGPIATPHVFIFDAERKLRFQGRIDDAELPQYIKHNDTRDALDALLAGKSPAVETTRVFGCSVKWLDKTDYNKVWAAQVAAEPVTVAMADAPTLTALRDNKDSGKIRLINVWATWCGPCVTEFPELVDTNLRFRGRDFELVTVAAEYPNMEAKVLKFLQERHASMRNVMFASTDKYALMEALDPEWGGALPHTIVVDEKGEILLRKSGPLDFLELRRLIVPALDKITPWGGLDGN